MPAHCSMVCGLMSARFDQAIIELAELKSVSYHGQAFFLEVAA